MSSNILETFVPGFGPLSNFLSEILGIDITALVSVGFLLFGLLKSIGLLRQQLLRWIIRWTTCSVSFDSHADAYHWVTELLEAKNVGKNYYDLIAISNDALSSLFTMESFYEIDGQSIPVTQPSTIDATSARNTKVRYEPAIDSLQYFWHKGNLYLWQRWKERSEQMNGYGSWEISNRIRARLYCFARTTEPIKAFVREAIARYESKNATKTTIRRPASSKQRRSGGSTWVKVTTRPSRALESVVLDLEKKQAIIHDMQEFLLPKTRRWYADRGIPYRRGYVSLFVTDWPDQGELTLSQLLSGPPGTGKTSLTFALAGVFELDIYCISLAEQSMTEEDLSKLFDSLPERCLVLLEDVDAAGLAIRGKLSKVGKLQTPMEQDLNDDIENDEMGFVEDLHMKSSRGDRSGTIPSTSRISLSGLLNVIDGVAASEGRLLVMTTNDIEHIDEALMRPGRIDLKIDFVLAARQDAALLFKQIFRSITSTNNVLDEDKKRKASADLEKIEKLAEKFASFVPPGVLGQAEIQGYLMTKKESPEQAVEDAEKWIFKRLGVV